MKQVPGDNRSGHRLISGRCLDAETLPASFSLSTDLSMSKTPERQAFLIHDERIQSGRTLNLVHLWFDLIYIPPTPPCSSLCKPRIYKVCTACYVRLHAASSRGMPTCTHVLIILPCAKSLADQSFDFVHNPCRSSPASPS